MLKVKCAVGVCHLAEEGGLELCCGVAGVKKLTKCHLEEKKEETVKYKILLLKGVIE